MNAKDGKKVLGIITARSGSKGIPEKCIKVFCEKPLLAWSVIAGKDSGVLDRVILSTDSVKYAEIGKKFGAEVPFLRPSELAQDSSPTLAVILHAIEWLQKNENYLPDYVVLLEPTSPCRRSFHIREAVNMILTTKADSVVGMSPVPAEFNFCWQFLLDDNNRAASVTGIPRKNIIARRQELPTAYYRNGVVYVFKTDLLFCREPEIYGADMRAYLIDEKYSHDINDLEQWKTAEISFWKILEEETA